MVEPSRVEELLLAALEKGTPEERAAYLDDACRDKPELRQKVENLLAVKPGENAHTVDSTREHVQVPTAMIGSRIGPYKLLQRLGEGGMGTVYLAEQEHPVKRRVALKIIKTGMDSDQVTARFEQERQALAVMDHPNIAKVLDAGATEAGRPFFVMELVKGIPITRFCDQEHLTPQQRLELFVPVCQAVQHAHQKGIIHRDLKPSNVLIALYDGKAVPKVIDFGVAKATYQKLTERTMFTEVGSIVGTLEYMAPEQAELNNLDIDTRADIYSLGVLMYELLTGSPPFTAKQLRGAAFTEMLRMIREVEPPKPSTRLSSSDELPSIAANRKLEPRRLTSLVTGELDWIVMKALEKDRGRRYETANGLAMDIERYLADEPVLASPPSAVYRMKKFVRRNKGPVAAAVGLLLALSAGVVGTSIGLVRAEKAWQAESKQRQIAQTKEKEAVAEKAKALKAAEQERLAKEEVKAQKAEVEAARDREAKERGYAEAIAKFVKDDFLALTSVEGQTRFDGEQLTKDATLRDLLDRAAEKLKNHKHLAPRTEAELCWIIGVSYRGIGEFAAAIPFLERSVELHRQASGPDEYATLVSQNSLAVAYLAAGQYDRAVALHEETLKLRKEKLGPDHPDTLCSQNNLAAAYQYAGRLSQAIELFEQARDKKMETSGTDDLETLKILHNLAGAYQDAGRLPEAIELFEHVRDARIAVLGPDDPDTLVTLHRMATAYHAAGRLPEAIGMLESVRDSFVKTIGFDHPDTLIILNNLATAYWSTKRLDKSIPLFEDLLKRMEARLGRNHPDTKKCVANLGVNYKDAGRLEEAIPLLEEAYHSSRQFQNFRGFGVPLLDAYVKAGMTAEVVGLVQEQLAETCKTLPQDSPQLAGVLAQAGLTLLLAKAWTDAEPILRECLTLREKLAANAIPQVLPWQVANVRSMLGEALFGQEKYAEAEPLLLAGYTGLKEHEATIPPEGKIRLTEAVQRLVDFYGATGQAEKADEWRKKLDETKPAEEKLKP